MDKEVVVYTYGVFDLMHPGHVLLLQRAKALGTKLIVGVISDEAVKEKKGTNRPIMPLKDRVAMVEALKCVDLVVVQDGFDPTFNLQKVLILNRVNVLAKGDDWEYIPGTEAIEGMGGKLVKLPYSKEWSTSDIIRRIRNDSNF